MHIHCDGASRGNPGHSAWGFVTSYGDSHGQYLEHATNNEVEYLALLGALDYLLDAGITDCTVYSDSRLIVEQANKRWKLKHHQMLGTMAQSRLEMLGPGVKVVQIPRSKNTEADALVNEILDAHVIVCGEE